ncbi:MAG TPA: ABC transporter ATP-binding protein [Acidimicrobiia bacterium]|nr:ABC transporter ATP-binding protein [Acidimicrobiia bacterium]
MSPTALPDLEVDGLSVRFGGLVAVRDVALRAPAGAITGLIGPNGAGKTTTFNACTGAVAATGSIRLGGHRLDGLSVAQRAQQGLGRTFQRIELFDAMTVAQNVAMGPEALQAGRRPWSQLWAGRELAGIRQRAAEAMDRCGIAGLADRIAGDLSTGQRRLVELARATASRFRFLLLDEPSSGLDVAETETFGTVLEDFVVRTGIGVLLVEHDMALVRRVCRHTYVLDFGQLVSDGPTAEVLGSALVRSVYLGEGAA